MIKKRISKEWIERFTKGVREKVRNGLNHKIFNESSSIFSKLSMKVKLLGSYLIVLVLLTTLAIVAYENINHLRSQVNYIGQTQVSKIEIIGKLKEQLTLIRLEASQHANQRDEQGKANIEDNIKFDITKTKESIKEMNQLNDSASDKKFIADFSKSFNDYVAYLPNFYDASKTNNYDIINSEIGLLGDFEGKATVSLDKLSEQIQSTTNAALKESEQNSSRSTNSIIIVSIIAILFSILVSILITRIIGRSVLGVAKNVDITTNSVSEIKKSIDQTAVGAQELDSSMTNAEYSVSELVASIQQVAGNTSVTSSGVEEITAVTHN